MQRVWSRLGEHRREEQTKQRVAEDVGRPEQRSAKKAEQRGPERQSGRERQSEEQSEADQEVRVAEIGIWQLKPWWEDCCFLRKVRNAPGYAVVIVDRSLGWKLVEKDF